MKRLAAALMLVMLGALLAYAADGQLLVTDQASTVPVHRTWMMLDAVVATTDGVWVDWRGFTLGTLHVDGITTATLQVRGSNALTKPDNADDGAQVGSDITADSFTTVTGPYRWLKVKVTSWTDATITAILTATTSGGGGSTASSGSVSVTGTATVAGAKTNNNAAPGATNVGALVCVANAAATSYTETNLTSLRCRLDGALAAYVPDSGESNKTILSAASTNATSVTSTATILTGIDCENPSTTTAAYLHVYNQADAPDPATDTATKIGTWDIGAAGASGQRGGLVKEFVNGLGGFTAGLGFTITGAADDTATTVAVANVRCNIQYHGKQL